MKKNICEISVFIIIVVLLFTACGKQETKEDYSVVGEWVRETSIEDTTLLTDAIIDTLNKSVLDTVDVSTYLGDVRFDIDEYWVFSPEGKLQKQFDREDYNAVCDAFRPIARQFYKAYIDALLGQTIYKATSDADYERYFALQTGYSIDKYTDYVLQSIEDMIKQGELSAVYKVENNRLYLAENTTEYDEKYSVELDIIDDSTFSFLDFYNNKIILHKR